MNLTDASLLELVELLTPAQRRAVRDHVRTGLRTDISRAALRRIKAVLKHRARSGDRRAIGANAQLLNAKNGRRPDAAKEEKIR